MRARHPDFEGVVGAEGISLGYEVYGDGAPTVLLMPTWTIIHSRFWKLQIPYLARHCRVIAYDGPGNGRSDRPLDTPSYAGDAQLAYTTAVMDATRTERAVLVSLSQAALWSLRFAAANPDRVLGLVFISPSLPLSSQFQGRASIPDTFDQKFDDPQGWEKYNAHYWRTNYADFADFFFSQCFSERHSTKQREDCVGWALETGSDVLIAEDGADAEIDKQTVLELCEKVTSPVLVMHGSDDQISPLSRGAALAAATGGKLIVLEGSGHIALARDPVKVNLILRRFINTVGA